MQGLGNDYLYIYGEVPENVSELAIKYSDRHFGIGSDGLIFISPSKVADFKMRIFNADGSEAKMCGNGIRCVGKYVYEKGYTDDTVLTVGGISPDGRLVETVELTDRDFYVGVQFHPEFKSRPNKAHPLFKGFIKASIDKKESK